MAILNKTQLEEQNQTQIQATVTIDKHKSVNTDLIDSSINRVDDLDLLGGGQVYNETTVVGYTVGTVVSYDDGGGLKTYAAKEVIPPSPGVFDPLKWDVTTSELGEAPEDGEPYVRKDGGWALLSDEAGIEYDSSLFVDLGGDNLNSGTSQASPFATIEKAIDEANAAIVGGKTQVAIYVNSGVYTMVNDKTLESGINIIGVGWPSIEHSRLTLNLQGGLFEFRANYCKFTGVGNELCFYTSSAPAVTTINIDLKNNIYSWSQTTENNGIVNIQDDSNNHIVNVDCSFSSGSSFVMHTRNVTPHLTASNCTLSNLRHQENNSIAGRSFKTTVHSSIITTGTLAIKTSGSPGIDATYNLEIGGLQAPGLNIVSLSDYGGATSVVNIDSVSDNYFKTTTCADVVKFTTQTINFEGPGNIQGSDGFCYTNVPYTVDGDNVSFPGDVSAAGDFIAGGEYLAQGSSIVFDNNISLGATGETPVFTFTESGQTSFVVNAKVENGETISPTYPQRYNPFTKDDPLGQPQPDDSETIPSVQFVDPIDGKTKYYILVTIPSSVQTITDQWFVRSITGVTNAYIKAYKGAVVDPLTANPYWKTNTDSEIIKGVNLLTSAGGSGVDIPFPLGKNGFVESPGDTFTYVFVSENNFSSQGG